MRGTRGILCTLAVLLTIPFAQMAAAQAGPFLGGPWSLETSGRLPDENVPCEFQGGGVMQQIGNQLTGQVSLTLVSGPTACPADMMADLSGTVTGSSFDGVLDGGRMFGMLDFTGIVGNNGRSLDGGFTVRAGGPFGGTTGSWSSLLRSVTAIPTANPGALILLAAALAAASLFLLRQIRG